MKKIYKEPTLKIVKFHVEDLITESVTDVLKNGGVYDEELGGQINFDEGNTLESINYGQFLQ
ncbi:MAG: hypothetical protein E7417_02860 [Ruminococcaceae bacterium]|nr:hypothetical protein [Oscillospiraceae bacterium]